MHDTQRRDYVLDLAVAAGKFSESRRPFWQAQYDHDPYGTEQALAAMSGRPATADGFASPYSAQLFPELARGRAQAPAPMAPPPPPSPAATPTATLLDTPKGQGAVAAQVAAWSRELFPDAVPEGRPWPQIAYANDG